MIADAYDDIADIAGDLFQVQWCFANTSDRDALWHFGLGYDSHWGDQEQPAVVLVRPDARSMMTQPNRRLQPTPRVSSCEGSEERLRLG